jgi:hypothetical protein
MALPRTFFWAFVLLAAALAARPAGAGPLTAPSSATGATREALPGGYALVVLPAGVPNAAATDARYRWRFTGSVQVFAPAPGDGNARKPTSDVPRPVVLVHYEAPDDAQAAARTARLCARLLRLHRERFGRPAVFPRGAGEAHVWLCRRTPPSGNRGGQTWTNHIYVFATGEPRSFIEWTRTLAHEWGHLTLPPRAATSRPKPTRQGYLGERLYLKWLHEEVSADNYARLANDWTDRSGLDRYQERQIAPLIARFRAAGPHAPALNGTGEAAMNLYVGAALACDDAFGSTLLGEGLFSVLGMGARDLFAALAEAVRRAPVLPVRLPAWVPLARATYRVSSATPPARVAFADRPPVVIGSGDAGGTALLRVRDPGWKWVRPVGSGAPTPAALGITLRVSGTNRGGAKESPS